MTETRKLAAILASDVVGYSRLTGADEDRTLARLRALRSDLIDPIISVHHGRVVKRTGDGAIVEFRSVVDAVRCAIEVQNGMVERNAGLPPERKIEFRIGIHLGDVVEESDGDLMGDGINVAARLEGIAKPGAISLSEDAYRQVKSRLDLTVSDLGETQLKNIVDPIRVYSLEVGVPAQAKPAPQAGSAEPSAGLALPNKPSIAVLPFQNMSGDPEQEYFADGMVEDVITGLSRINWLFVIARNSSFVYKGKAVDVKQVGRELGVRYVLEGSVRKAGKRVRITGQLIEAETGAHLWADKFDGAVDDVFDLQDRITESVVGVIEPNVRRAEIERVRRKRPHNLGAYDLLLRALPHIDANNPTQNDVALPFLEKALELDPHYALAHGYMAYAHEQRFMRGGFDSAVRERGLWHAREALAGGAEDALALALGGFVVGMLDNDFAAALSALDRSIALNGNSAIAHGFSALVRAFAGDAETSIMHAERALRLSPFDALRANALVALALDYIFTHRHTEAAQVAAKAIQANPAFPIPYAILIFAQVSLGQLDEARISVKRLQTIDPSASASGFARQMARATGNVERGVPFADALHKAGLPH